jgi:gluconokinase
MSDIPLVWMIIGVSGSGKTSIGRGLAAKLDCDFLEGDRRHPAQNIQKMHLKHPLEDADRQEWLTALAADIDNAVTHGIETVVTCSALKVDYRKKLTKPGRVQLIWLDVPEAELKRRIAERQDSFMSEDMLPSQLAAFESIKAEENVIQIAGILTVDETVQAILAQIYERFPMRQTSWWQRAIDELHESG